MGRAHRARRRRTPKKAVAGTAASPPSSPPERSQPRPSGNAVPVDETAHSKLPETGREFEPEPPVRSTEPAPMAFAAWQEPASDLTSSPTSDASPQASDAHAHQAGRSEDDDRSPLPESTPDANDASNTPEPEASRSAGPARRPLDPDLERVTRFFPGTVELQDTNQAATEEDDGSG